MLDQVITTQTSPFLLLVACILYFIVPAYRSPLRHVPPAHPLARFTSKWILWRRFWQLENTTIRTAHAKFGPVVLLGPGEVSVNCVKGGLTAVYTGGFEKPGVTDEEWGFYKVFYNYGVPNMFSTSTSKAHSQRKRMLSNIYSKSVIQSSDELTARATKIFHERVFPILSGVCSTSVQSRAASEFRIERGVIDAYLFVNALTMDIVTSYIFGLRSSACFTTDVQTCKWFLSLYNSRHGFSFWYHETINFIRLMSKLRLDTVFVPSRVAAANNDIQNWTMNMVHRAREIIDREEAVKAEDTPIVIRQLYSALKSEAGKDPTNPRNDPAQMNLAIASELLDHHAAGFDTSGITLTYLVYELSLPHNQHLQTALREELLSLETPLKPAKDSEEPKIPDAKALDALPLLQAILQETLRLHSAIPGPQPREVPAQGAWVGPGASSSTNGNAKKKSGNEEKLYFIPPKTRVSASAGSLHLNPDVYPEPEKFKPERWMTEGGARKEMDRWFWAFGSGGRMCVGSNLAIYQMKMIVAAIYTNYLTSIVNDEGIEQVDAYTAGPKRRSLIIRLEPVES